MLCEEDARVETGYDQYIDILVWRNLLVSLVGLNRDSLISFSIHSLVAPRSSRPLLHFTNNVSLDGQRLQATGTANKMAGTRLDSLMSRIADVDVVRRCSVHVVGV